LLRPAELPLQISIARRWLTYLREGRLVAGQNVESKLRESIGALDDA
jgi:hypothetical protein